MQARRPHVQPRESDHANAGGAPATGPWPARYTALLPTTRPQSHESERGQKEAHPPPAPSKPEKTAGQKPPNPRTPPDPLDQPDQASSSSSLRCHQRPTRTKHHPHPPSNHHRRPIQTKHPHHPPTRHQHRGSPKRTQISKNVRKSNSPSATTNTGDWIWCAGTIQYRLRELRPNEGVQIWVTCHRQRS